MKATKIRVGFTRTINMGNYESVRFEADVEGTVDPSEDLDAAYKQAFAIVKQQVRIRVKQTEKQMLEGGL